MNQSPASRLVLKLYQPHLVDPKEWKEIGARSELSAIAAELLGPHARECGDELWWHCPFHRGESPSLWVAEGESRWSCMGCEAGGNATALVMRVRKVGFEAATRWLTDRGHSELFAASQPVNDSASSGQTTRKRVNVRSSASQRIKLYQNLRLPERVMRSNMEEEQVD
jgi:DNA primase